MNYQVKYGQSIYDLALSSGYTIDFVYKLIQENPFVDSINYDFDANPGQEIFFDETFKVPPPPQLTKNQGLLSSNFKTIKARDGQNFYDLILQSGYPFEKLYEFLQANGITNIDVSGIYGHSFTFDLRNISDVGFYRNIQANKIFFATAVTEDVLGYLQQENGFFILQENGFKIII